MKKLLALFFFFSGFASLLYQVAWQRVLTLYYGVGSISITLIVSVYMLGLGIGALVGGRIAEKSTNRIQVYAGIECLIGCFGVLSIPFLNFLGRATAGSDYAVAFIYMFLFLCLPTLLMGATLPLLIKIFNRLIHDFVSSVSWLYFLNTIGAALGALFSSYVLISFWGLKACVYTAAALNLILAAIIIYSGRFSKYRGPRDSYDQLMTFKPTFLGQSVFVFVFASGFLAIGYELVWFRVIGVLVKASPYAFSTVLGVYLCGIALGSFYIYPYLQKKKPPCRPSLFFFCNSSSAFTVSWSSLGFVS